MLLRISFHQADPKMVFAMRDFMQDFYENIRGDRFYLSGDISCESNEHVDCDITFFSKDYAEPYFKETDRRRQYAEEKEEQERAREETTGQQKPDSEAVLPVSGESGRVPETPL